MEIAAAFGNRVTRRFIRRTRIIRPGQDEIPSANAYANFVFAELLDNGGKCTRAPLNAEFEKKSPVYGSL